MTTHPQKAKRCTQQMLLNVLTLNSFSAQYPVVHRFMGFFGGNSDSAGSGYDSDPDDYYIQSHAHKSKFSGGEKFDVSELHHAI
jgi:hypothetical protein